MSRPIAVLVTGVGAIIGQGIIRSLRRGTHPVRIIGVDRSDQSPGPSMCDLFRIKPACDEADPAYLEFWATLLREEAVELVMPGIEHDVFFFDAQRELVQGTGARLVINRAELIALSADKWRMSEELATRGLPGIPTSLTPDWQEAQRVLGPPPLLLKPRRGNGSRGIARLADATDFSYWRTKSGSNWMLQRSVGSDDDEYTVGAFGLAEGRALPPIIFRRRLSAAGNTLAAEVVTDDEIAAATEVLCQRFQPLGPTNFQFRKEGRTCYLLEINPRFSSSTSLRAAFGYNEADMSIDLYLYGREPAAPTIQRGKAWRYSEDFVVYDRNPL